MLWYGMVWYGVVLVRWVVLRYVGLVTGACYCVFYSVCVEISYFYGVHMSTSIPLNYYYYYSTNDDDIQRLLTFLLTESHIATPLSFHTYTYTSANVHLS